MAVTVFRPGLNFVLQNVRVFKSRVISYLVRDEFTTALAAGSVNGTAAEPGTGTRTVVDAENKLSLSGGLLTFAGGKTTPVFGDPGYWLPGVTRAPGRLLVANFNKTSGVSWMMGWGRAQSGSSNANATYSGSTDWRAFGNNGATDIAIGAISVATNYTTCIALRALGAFWFIRGGSYTNQTLGWISTTDSTATVYPSISNSNCVFTSDFIRVPGALWLPTPLASDGFASSFATTDGLGHAETTGVGSGGNGLTWTQQAGTWTVASAKASASALSGGIAIATVPTSTADVLADAKVTRSAGQGGLVLRYTDASNYLYANHDGTNCFLKQVLAGVTTTLVTAAATYGANAVIRCDLSGVAGRLYYNNLLVGSTASINAALTATAHGLYVTDVTANLTLDDFVVYSKGTAGEYAILDNY